MKISVFGNEDLPEDSLPVKLIPKLEKEFPEHEFIHQDPTEDVLPPDEKEWIIIDTVEGIDKVELFDDVKKINSPRWVSLHDYDLAMHLSLIKKLYPDLKIRIIGVPQRGNGENIFKEVVSILTLYNRKNTNN